jgi:hypothetical protein
MKIQYLIIAIVLLGCSPEDARVTGFIILNKNETVSALPVNDSDNSSAIVREKPTLLVYPQMLVAKTSVDDNANESTSSKRPIVLPILTVAPTTTKSELTLSSSFNLSQIFYRSMYRYYVSDDCL